MGLALSIRQAFFLDVSEDRYKIFLKCFQNHMQIVPFITNTFFVSFDSSFYSMNIFNIRNSIV